MNNERLFQIDFLDQVLHVKGQCGTITKNVSGELCRTICPIHEFCITHPVSNSAKMANRIEMIKQKKIEIQEEIKKLEYLEELQ